MIKIPNYVEKILNRLDNLGFEAYVVGGCVRDSFRGVEPLDWDVCTSAKPEQVIDIFKGFLPVIPTGIKHGTVTVLSENTPVEVTTYRTDGEYLNSRHPEKVRFISSVTEDLARRDFTVNAMAYHPQKGLVDPFGGRYDIQNKIIRCVGEPQKRFNEDALRILRAIRFSAVCEFKIDGNTADAIHRQCGLLNNISAERVLSEIKKLLRAEMPSETLIEYRDIFGIFMIDMSDLTYIKMTDILPNNVNLRLSAILGNLSDNELKLFLNKLKVPNKLKYKVKCILENKAFPIPETKSDAKRMLRQFGIENSVDILTFMQAKATVAGREASSLITAKEYIDEIIRKDECFSVKGLDICGSDLIDIGIKKGTEIGRILDSVLELVIDEKTVNRKSELIKAAKDIYGL